MKPKHTILDWMAVSLLIAAPSAFADLTPETTPGATRQAIQDAIDAAAAMSPVGTVTLGSGLFEIDSQLMVTGGVTLVGQGWERTIIKQTATSHNANTRVMSVKNGATVRSVTLTGGSVNGNWTMGGGADVDNGMLSWCCITNNAADGGNNKYGGGVFIARGQIDHCIIADNVVRTTAADVAVGGGVGVRNPSGTVTIDSCLIAGNHAFTTGSHVGQGGAIGVEYNANNVNVVKVRNVTIVGNRAGDGETQNVSKGGAVYAAYPSGNEKPGTFVLLDSIISDNTTVNTNVSVNVVSGAEVDYCLFDIEADKIGENSRYEAAAFIDAANGDYHLGASSPAIGRGTTYTEIGVDLDNVTFSDPPSMGCYEYADRAAEPAFEPASGILFYPSTNVTLSCETTGATIYYTTDGSTPTDSGTAYSGPIPLSATTTIKARAYATGKGPSAIVSATYTYQRPTPPPTAFAKSVEITLAAALATTEITTGVPALVKLSASNISGFDYNDFTLAKGGDMMFVDANGNPLPHEVDTWNTSGESLVWVKLPSTAANTTITMYYGKGTTSNVSSTDVWADYVGVWHLGEEGGANTDVTVHDSTEHGYTGTAKGIATSGSAAGKIGAGWRISDSSTSSDKVGGILMDSMTNVTLGAEFTISAWMWHKNQAYYYDHVFYRRNASNDGTAGWWSEINAASDNVIKVNGGANGGTEFLINTTKGVWKHLSLVYSGTTGYSVADGGEPVSHSLTAAASDNDKPIAFGTDSDNNDVSWKGIFDELRIRKGPYDSNYLKAEYKAMNTAETDIFTYGAAQDTGPETTVQNPLFDPASGATFYPSTNVTLSCATDGATIYYTTDGTDPTDSSTEYTAPISVSATTTIKAIAYKQDLDPSAVVSATYMYVTPPVGIQPGESAAANTQTIQDAIDAAAALSPAGTVVLGAGTFEIDAQLMVTNGVTLVGQGWDSTIIKQTATPGANTRVVTIDDGSTVAHVTLTGGRTSATWASGSGAGAYVKNGTISWCRVSGNATGVGTATANNLYGAAVSFYEGKGRIDHSIIDSNEGGSRSGYCHGGGIGIYNPSGAITIDASLVFGNSATGDGGGIYASFGNYHNLLTVRNSTIAGNESSGTGGGVYTAEYYAANKFSFAFVNSLLADNVSGSEGADPNLTLPSDDRIVSGYAAKSSNNLFANGTAALGTQSQSVSGSGEAWFVDAANGDYHLIATSPAIDAGATYEGIGVDLDNVAFANPPAVGCYEYGERVADPEFAPAPGSTFYPTVDVTISCATEGATIYYTTDGSLPTDSSDEYTGAITLSATTTVKARAYAAGMGPSAVATATYTYKKIVGSVISVR